MKPHRITSALGALLLIVGTFLPWVSFFGISTNGWSNGMGVPVFFIFCVAVCIAMAFIPVKWVNAFSVLFSLILVALGFLYISDAGSMGGSGLYLFLVGGIVLFVGAIMGFFQKTA